MIFNLVSKALSMIAMVLGVSLTIPYLGAERFGVWMTIASFSAMLTFLDLGVGNALTNHVAKSAASGRADDVVKLISGGLGFMALLGASVSVLLFALSFALPWHQLIRTTSESAGLEAAHTATLFGVLFGLSIFATGIQKVFAGLQRAFEAHIATAAGSLLSILGLLIATHAEASVPVLLLVTLGSQLISALSLLVLLLGRSQFSFGSMASGTLTESSKLLRVGSLFFVLQIGTMVGWGADSLIISSTLGAAHVAIYGVMQRLVQFVSIPLSIVNGPLWAAYADAHVRQDTSFIRRTLKHSAMLTFALSAVGAVTVALVTATVVQHWTKGAIEVDRSIVLLFCVWIVLETCGNAFAMFLNGCGIIRPQVVSVVLFCLIVTPLKFMLTSQYGVAGTLSATIGCYILAVPILYSTIFRRSISSALQGHE